METIDILETLRQKVADGDSKGAEEFLIAHFKELPEDLQGDLLLQFVKEAGSGNRLEHMAGDLIEATMKILDRIESAQEALDKTPEGEVTA